MIYPFLGPVHEIVFAEIYGHKIAYVSRSDYEGDMLALGKNISPVTEVHHMRIVGPYVFSKQERIDRNTQRVTGDATSFVPLWVLRLRFLLPGVLGSC